MVARGRVRLAGLLLVAAWAGGCRSATLEERVAEATPERPVVIAAPAVKDAAEAAPVIAARTMDPERAAKLEAWRPMWWHDEAVLDGPAVRVCGLATAEGLSVAREGAIEAAAAVLGTVEPGVVAGSRPRRLDAVQLGDGQFRAFVQLVMPRDAAARR